jgi:phosphatidate cytidylyltransferase
MKIKINKLILKTLIGILLGLLVLVVIYMASLLVFYLLISLVIFIAITEYFMMHEMKLKSGYYFITLFVSLFFPAFFYFSFLWTSITFEQIILVTLIVYAFRAVLSSDSPNMKLKRLIYSLSALFYIGLFFSYQINIRMYGGGGRTAQNLLLYLYAIVVINDSFAYYFGTFFGKHKLSPKASPKKTIEGAIAGMVGGLIAATACYFVFLNSLTLKGALAGAVVIGITAQVGDLLESILKRSVKVKDASILLAGHGGVLDRLDSLVLTSPVFYVIIDYLKQI